MAVSIYTFSFHHSRRKRGSGLSDLNAQLSESTSAGDSEAPTMRSELFLPLHNSSPSSPCSRPFISREFGNLEFPKCRRLRYPRFQFRASNSLFGNGWKLKDIDPDAVQERLSSWIVKTQNFINEVAAPLRNTGHGSKADARNELINEENEEIFMVEQTIHSATPNGNLSLAAVVSIEQFSRLNGLTGKKMQKIFEALAPESVHNNARNLVEYCCFRYLSRDNSAIHPSLKEAAFQRLIFVTMLAWDRPYCKDNDVTGNYYQSELASEEAFIRIAPAVAGVADRSTAHNLYKSLVGDDSGMSLSLWIMYVNELLRVHQGRKSYQSQDSPHLPGEQILCIGTSRKRPVLKWENNVAWPGKLTLTDKALYFEPVSLTSQKEVMRLDLTVKGSKVKKTRVGPMGYAFFDSAIAVTSGSRSDTWVLEFVNFGGEMRRDVWHAFTSEVIYLYEFVREYGPPDNDPSAHHVYGAHKGKGRAVTSASNSIARLQTLQYMQKMTEDPSKLVQFTYLRNAPYGDVVCQTLAVHFWGGPLIRKVDQQTAEGVNSLSGSYSTHVVDVDGSIYLRRWMKSSSWGSSASVAFWKSYVVRQGVVLGKNLVVGDKNLVERAAEICKERSQIVEKTQATIDAAMIKGIPSNIDLFKELLLPFTVIYKIFKKLRRWEEPHVTISFLVAVYTIISRNLLSYVLPVTLMSAAVTLLLLKGLKEQGRLGRSFGRVTIRDQPPSNTIQKIVALKEAMADLENYLQSVNVTLLKIRTIVLSGQPQVTGEVAIVLFCAASTLLLVPFRYILAFFLLDLFTRELEFRREMVQKFMALLSERWATVPAAPVVVLPFDGDKQVAETTRKEIDGGIPSGSQSNWNGIKSR